MPSITQNHIMKGGEILSKQTKRGIELHAWNHERQRRLHVGTVKGSTYEKVARILRQPEPSFALTQSEFGAVVDAGAEYIRIVSDGATYAVSVQDFERMKQPHYHSGYGPQWRLSVNAFQRIGAKAKRNAFTDNPARGQARPIISPIKQLGLFG